MPNQPAPPKTPPAEPRKDSEREMQQAIIENADENDGKDRDLVHGDGGTIGMGADDDLGQDD